MDANDILAAHARKVALGQEGHGKSQGRSHSEPTTEKDMVRRLLLKKKPETTDDSMATTPDPAAGDTASLSRKHMLAKLAVLCGKG